MKKLLGLFWALAIMLTFAACEGNWESVNLKDPIAIPENGVIERDVLEQIKNENAIGIFTGASDEISYEWTIFGSDIVQAKEINLGAKVSRTTDGVQVVLAQKDGFGFSALLSISLNELFGAQSATAYADGKAFASVSVTGSKMNTLNISLDATVQEFVIHADPVEQETTETGTQTEEASQEPTEQDAYLSKPQNGDGQVYTNGKDKYLTDPVPEGKPQPVEPEDAEVNKSTSYTCTFSIECSTILNNLDMLDADKLEVVPSDGVILARTTVTFNEGESVYDVLQRICKEKGIHMEASWTPIYNSAYVEGIHNLYEFDCGSLSGWMYCVNGWYPNYGSSRYQLRDGDVVEWRFTCDLGNDIGGGYAVGG